LDAREKVLFWFSLLKNTSWFASGPSQLAPICLETALIACSEMRAFSCQTLYNETLANAFDCCLTRWLAKMHGAGGLHVKLHKNAKTQLKRLCNMI